MEEIKIRKRIRIRRFHLPKMHFHKMPFVHMHKELEFSCAWNATRIALDFLKVQVSESELFSMTGDKNMGTSHWEIKKVLNFILRRNIIPWRAEISKKVRLNELVKALQTKTPVIIMFLTPFKQEGMSDHAYYPHFALLKSIDGENSTIRLLSPSGGGVEHPEVPGEPGVVEFNIHEFLELFYARPKFIMRVEYLPTRKRGFFKNSANWIYNFFLQLALMCVYCLRILKPGTAIFIKPIP